MKKNVMTLLSTSLLATMLLTLQSAKSGDDVMTKENGTYIINTTTLGKNVEGYNGPTPLKVYIKKNKVVKVEPLKNMETPKYFAMVKKSLMNKWNDMSTKDAASKHVDAVTGATYSSEAVVKNVKLAIDYYNAHK